MNRRRFLKHAGAWSAAAAASNEYAFGARLPEDVSLNGEWDFTYGRPSAVEVPDPPAAAAFDSRISVPGLWDEQLERFRGAKWRAQAQFLDSHPPVRYLVGTGWYRKVIDVPSGWRGRSAVLTVGWAVGTVHVWLNGARVGSYDYCVYTPYTLDLSNHFRFGEKNELLIAVDNTGLVHYDSGQGSGKRFAGGWALMAYAGGASGIGRGVSLRIAGGSGRIANVFVRPGAHLAEVACDVELENIAGKPSVASEVSWQILSADAGAVLTRGVAAVPAFTAVHKIEWKSRVEGIKAWSPQEPNLYRLEVRWTVGGEVRDIQAQRFGLRRFTGEGRKLKLNGEPIYLRGDFGPYYFPVECTLPLSKEYYVTYLRRAKEIGFNFINFAAKVSPPEMLEAADELGMIVQCGDHMTVLEPYRKYYKEVWTPIVKATRNSPSMCIYGFGGERNYYEGIIEQHQAQYDLIKSLHPDALVMPQQALRGIDYAFDEQGRKELTLAPFPHHAGRLARYRKACDLYGHYSTGAFGYDYFADPWQEMEQRFAIYDRPLVAHELYMGTSYLNPANANKYTGRIPPHLYTKLERDLGDAGLAGRWSEYHRNCCLLQSITKKYCVEKTRKCDRLAGFEFLGMTDQHHTRGHYATGILDEFLDLKPGDTVEGILRYNRDNVVLLDFDGQSINRSYWAGEDFEADVLLSLYGRAAIAKGRLAWSVNHGATVLQKGEVEIANVPRGVVTRLSRIRITWPRVDRTTHVNLAMSVTGAGDDIANDWDFWVFLKASPPEVNAAADPDCLERLKPRFGTLKSLAEDSGTKLRILSELRKSDLEHLEQGGDVLLLGGSIRPVNDNAGRPVGLRPEGGEAVIAARRWGTMSGGKPFPLYTGWRTFRPGLGGRNEHNAGTAIAQHPIFDGLPHEGWGDWHFYPILEGAACVLFNDKLPTRFDPILEIISSGGQIRKQAAIFEKTVGRGRLMVSTCTISLDNPSCVTLTDGILRYVQSDAFRPRSELPLDALAKLVGA